MQERYLINALDKLTGANEHGGIHPWIYFEQNRHGNLCTKVQGSKLRSVFNTIGSGQK